MSDIYILVQILLLALWYTPVLASAPVWVILLPVLIGVGIIFIAVIIYMGIWISVWTKFKGM